jgi:hypothetical protein
MDDLEDIDRTLRERLDAIGPEARAILLHVLKLPNLERVRSIEEFYSDPRTRTFAQLLVDIEESPHARAFVLGELAT